MLFMVKLKNLPRLFGGMQALFFFFICFQLTACASINKDGIKKIQVYNLSSTRLPKDFDGARILLASDFHLPSLLKKEGLQLIVEQINSLQPDLILLGGDYTNKAQSIKETFVILAALKASMGVFAVLGNHDEYNGREETIEAIGQAGIVLLENNGVWLERGNSRIFLAGTADYNFQIPCLDQALNETNEEDFVIGLSHHPDFWAETDLSKIDLALSGHTHGGQIVIFGWAPYLPSSYGQRFRYGLIELENKKPLIVTSGIGTTHLPLRIGAKSELALIVLQTKRS